MAISDQDLARYIWWYYSTQKGNKMNEVNPTNTGTPEQDALEVPAFLKRTDQQRADQPLPQEVNDDAEVFVQTEEEVGLH